MRDYPTAAAQQMGQKMRFIRAPLTVEQLGRKHAQIHSFPDCAVVFLREVKFLRKLFEDVLMIKTAVLCTLFPSHLELLMPLSISLTRRIRRW